jgi:hypothetical protein
MIREKQEDREMTALQEFLSKVEAGEWDNVCAFSAFDGKHLTIVANAFDGSLDAAKALHEAVIDDYTFLVGFDWAEVWLPFGSTLHNFNVSNTIPARAWLIAIIKVLILEAEE